MNRQINGIEKTLFLCLIFAFSFGCARRLDEASKYDSIVVDMPHGLWRIHVHPDGSGRYGFGALPQFGRISKGTFNFNALYADLSEIIVEERDYQHEIYGTVQFCIDGEGCGRLWFFYDQALANELFDLAYQNREGSAAGMSGESLQAIDSFWLKRSQD